MFQCLQLLDPGAALQVVLQHSRYDPGRAICGCGNDPATGGPFIQGSVVVGETLSIHRHNIEDPDGVTRNGEVIRWLVDGEVRATFSTFPVREEYLGQTIQVSYQFIDAQGTLETGLLSQ